MSERFTKLYELKKNLYSEDSPVIVSAGALLKDNGTGSIIVQLKFQSISQKCIKAVKVSLSAFDVSEKEVQGVPDYQYLDLRISNGETFGAKKAIIMPSEVTRSFLINKILVVFGDNSVWENTSPFMALSPPRSLNQMLEHQEISTSLLAEQYCLETSWESEYVPQEERGLWQCACGCWNSGIRCTNCETRKKTIFSALDLTFLTERTSARLEQEKEQQEAELKRKALLIAEAAAKREIRQKRLRVIIPVILILAIVIGLGSVLYTKSKEITIEKLLELSTREEVSDLFGAALNEGDYDYYEAIALYEDNFNAYFYYKDNELNKWKLSFIYPEWKELRALSGIAFLKAQTEASSTAISVMNNVLSELTSQLGGPEVIELDCECIAFKWSVNDCTIELYSRSKHVLHSSVGGVVEIYASYERPSRCKHTNIKTETIIEPS